MKIGVYVLTEQAKQNYANECYDIRINAGMLVVLDILRRAGYENIDYCSVVNAHKFDIVLFSVTSDCDWWKLIGERILWRKGNYKLIVGGQGVLNVRPFLQFVDYFVLGRAEGIIDKLVQAIDKHGEYEGNSVVNSKLFNADNAYVINQVEHIYPYDIRLPNGRNYHEDTIGCNHKCLFCNYSWTRKHNGDEVFRYTGLWNGVQDRERAIIDLDKGTPVDMNKLRITAIDGLSERLRFMVKKNITSTMLKKFLHKCTEAKPHQIKFYNIIGYPTETEQDWQEFLENIREVDKDYPKREKQMAIVLHSTPFRAMPATPLACAPMQYKNYRGAIASTLGKGLKGNIFYQGNALWAVESMGTESLSTVILSAVIIRGTEKDSENIAKISTSKKFQSASSPIKQATLEKYFNVTQLFGGYKVEDLPTKYLRTFCQVEKLWGKNGFIT